MSTRLDQIVAATRRRVAETKAQANLCDLENEAKTHVPRGFRRALAEHPGIAVIAELKKASPSKGLIRANFDVKLLTQELEAAGAAALSVLTDEEFFQGSLENLRIASSVTRIPCLRKDFMIDEFQIVEARANQADAILLIVAALSQAELTTLKRKAKEQELDVLCEVHDEEELKRALDAGCDLIGVNNRNLKTFEVKLATALNLAEQMPRNVLTVAESGIHSASDMAKLKAAGYQAFLIGESLMKATSPGDALRALTESAVAL
ncbi:MAG TPA: indole-3-glycerol phosphate synthase TrpC [Terriglobales bacterium]|nr:indole-3-glycerol phosphate synthase TrpC [Terriglobales bacterium]